MKIGLFETIAYVAVIILFVVAHVHFELSFEWFYLAPGAIALIAYLSKCRHKADPSTAEPNKSQFVSPYMVKWDETEIVVFLNGKRHESVDWADLSTVGISIEQQGFTSSPFWLLGGRSGSCMYPSDAIGHEAALDEFKHRLPGFDCDATYETIIQAMTAVEGGFVVWARAGENAMRTAESA